VPIVVDMEAKTITYMDSQAGTRGLEGRMRKDYMAAVLEYLKDEHLVRHGNRALPRRSGLCLVPCKVVCSAHARNRRTTQTAVCSRPW
jgi:hypothetical protein